MAIQLSPEWPKQLCGDNLTKYTTECLKRDILIDDVYEVHFARQRVK